MDFLDEIFSGLKTDLITSILENFEDMFTSINQQVNDVAVQVSQTPRGWNSSVYEMIKNLSETVIIPIAGIILTFVMCYELIQMIIDKNNMHDFDTFNLYKWIFKTFVAVFILTHTFDIVMAVFELGQHTINASAGLINSSLDIQSNAAIDKLREQLEALDFWSVLGVWMEINIVKLCITAMSVCIFIITFGRMLEIYLTVSVAPIPFSTMVNREWGQMGNNYLKSLFAVAFQGFLIMVCLAIYAVLIQTIGDADNIHFAIWGCVGYTALLCFTLFKTGSLSKNIFGTH